MRNSGNIVDKLGKIGNISLKKRKIDKNFGKTKARPGGSRGGLGRGQKANLRKRINGGGY